MLELWLSRRDMPLCTSGTVKFAAPLTEKEILLEIKSVRRLVLCRDTVGRNPKNPTQGMDGIMLEVYY